MSCCCMLIRYFFALDLLGRSVTDGSAYFKKWNGERFVRVCKSLPSCFSLDVQRP